MKGYGILLVPFSWALGRWIIEGKKTLWAFGPLRFVVHHNLGKWKQ